MSAASLIKVTDEHTGRLIRYETKDGETVAVVRSGKLHITERGQMEGYVISNGKLINYNSKYSAY